MPPIAQPLAITIDCHDPRRLLEFWQQLVGGEAVENSPEGKSVKNRVHLDLDVPDIEHAVVMSTRIGATRHGTVREEPANFFQVMSDPEGNEFCFILLK